MKRFLFGVLAVILLLGGCTTTVSLCGPGPAYPLNVDRSQEAAPTAQKQTVAVKDSTGRTTPVAAPVPVRVTAASEPLPGTKRVKLYFAQPARHDAENCPSVTYVERDIVIGSSPAQTVMLELLKGPTQEEKTAGFITAFDAETELKDVVVRGSLIEVRFVKLKSVAPDGCTTGSLRKQVISTMTALNIAGVTRIGITPMLK